MPATPPPQSTNEDTALTFNTTNNKISISDVDANPTSSLKVTLSVPNGTLTLNGTSGLSFATGDGTNDANMTFTGTLSNINTALNGMSFTPNANYFGPSLLTITTDDQGNTGTGGAKSDSDPVQIFVTPVDDNPVAVNDTKTVAEDDPATTINVLANDTDVDGGPKTIASVTQPINGTVAITNGGNDLTYKPNANYCNGGSPTDNFTYTLNGGSTATVAVTVTCVNDVPVAEADSYNTDEDNTLNVDAPGVLDNDTDADDGDSLTATKIDGPAHGTLTLNADGSFEYTPDANYNGPDSFTYKANDGTADSNTATVNIDVTAVNDKPTADDQSVTTDEDVDKTITLTGSDIDEGDNLTYDVVDSPQHGTLSGTGAPRTYTPNADYNGPDSFTYKVNDGTVDSDTATVNIDVKAVNDAPVAEDQEVTTDEDIAKEVTLSASDVDEGDNLSYTIVSEPQHGTLSGTGANLTYTPDENYNGSDSFTYKANDGTTDSNTATVDITVNAVNDAPVAEDQLITTDEDIAKDVTLDASDVENDNLTYEIVDSPQHGTLSGTGAPRTYTPDPDYFGEDSFTYKANDGTADSNVAKVSITVNAVNDAPVAKEDSYDVDEDNTLTVDGPGVLSNDEDVDNTAAELKAVLVSGPAHGTLMLNDNGSFEYKPNADFFGDG